MRSTLSISSLWMLAEFSCNIALRSRTVPLEWRTRFVGDLRACSNYRLQGDHTTWPPGKVEESTGVHFHSCPIQLPDQNLKQKSCPGLGNVTSTSVKMTSAPVLLPFIFFLMWSLCNRMHVMPINRNIKLHVTNLLSSCFIDLSIVFILYTF